MLQTIPVVQVLLAVAVVAIVVCSPLCYSKEWNAIVDRR